MYRGDEDMDERAIELASGCFGHINLSRARSGDNGNNTGSRLISVIGLAVLNKVSTVFFRQSSC